MHRSMALQAHLNRMREAAMVEGKQQSVILLNELEGIDQKPLNLHNAELEGAASLVGEMIADHNDQAFSKGRQLGHTLRFSELAAGAAVTLAYPVHGGEWSVMKPKTGHPRTRNKSRKKVADKSRRRNRQ